MQIIILGYGGAQATFDRHLPLWKAHGLPMAVFSPSDDPLRVPAGILSVQEGFSSHYGPEAAFRLLGALNFVATSDRHTHSVIFEYDSFCIDIGFVAINGLHGIIAANDNLGRFMTTRYAWPPWMLDRDSAKKMVDVAAKYPDITEEGFHDRLLCAWAFIAGVPILPHPEHSVSDNTLAPPYTPVLQGPKPVWVHGVKDQGCLDAVLSRWKS